MQKLSEILRLISLAVLSAGSAAVVFVAVTLVKTQHAQGVPISEAAAANAPAFIQFAKVATGAAIVLLVSEAMGFLALQKGLVAKSKVTFGRMGASLLCAVAAFVFAFVFVPPMSELQPQMKNDQAKYEEFQKLHKGSQGVFGATILLAFIALILPVFAAGPNKSTSN